ncbi:hypothetical protein [Marinovum sp.]|uniref:hypothetical protein n=1 Tax=Marinovum sp. TaxID=2024839 RepID=UPI002B277239|nr:hypothetical protein [Marinovum sp.]
MRKTLSHIALVALAGLLPATAGAACLAEFKAKRDNPLALFYDIAPIRGACTQENAEAQLRAELARQGQTLLKVLSVREE